MDKQLINSIERKLNIPEPVKNLGWFLILFLSFEFIWKVCVHQGHDESILIVLGKNLTSYTYRWCAYTAQAVYWVAHNLMGYDNFRIDGTLLYFTDSLFKTNIIWGCVSIKQVLMFVFIMMFYFGPLKKKIWYIPTSVVILIGINIVRLTALCFITKNPFPEWFIGVNEWYNDRTWINNEETFNLFYKDWFNLFHHDIFTWIYYDGILFLMWLFWEERFNKPYQKLKAETTKDN